MAPQNSTRNPLKTVDWMLLSMILALYATGWAMIYAAGYGQGYPDLLSDWLLKTPIGKQSIYLGISLLLLLCTLVLDRDFWRNGAFLIYTATLVLLLAVLFFGKEIKGAQSWFSIMGFSLQPSEFAKFGTVLAVSSYLAGFRGQIRQKSVWLVGAGLFVLPILLILLQPDAGSALVFCGITLILYRAGLNANLFLIALIAGTVLVTGLIVDPLYILMATLSISVIGYSLQYAKNKFRNLSIALLMTGALGFVAFYQQQFYLAFGLLLLAFLVFSWYWYTNRKDQFVVGLTAFNLFSFVLAFVANYLFNNVLAPHQQDRLNVWLQPSKCDPRGSLYNVLQSKMAIGAGGFQGKGLLNGTLTKLRYVPEQTTDFIFCTVGEEHGFVGVSLMILLFAGLLWRLLQLAERQKSLFNLYYMYGVVGIVFIHFLLNIGMTMGLMPIIGIPLPFISYGGSSLIAFTLIFGVALRLDASRSTR